MNRFLAAAMVVAAVNVAHAQPTEEAPAAPPSEPPPPSSAPDTQVQYDAAYSVLLRGDFASAGRMFASLAASASDPTLRANASELARLASDLAARNARLAFVAPAPPGLSDAPPTLDAARAAPVSEDDAPDGGRASFVVTTTLASLYSGVVLVDLLDTDDVRSGTLVVLGTTTAGVLGSVYGTRGKTMTGAMADSWGLGLTVGAANALLLSGPIGLFDSPSNASEKVQSLTLVSAWGLGAAGLAFADAYRPTRAQVSVTGTFGLMGIASTGLLLGIIQPESTGEDTILTVLAAGLDASLVAGGLYAKNLDWSHSRARYVGLGALLGGIAGGGLSLLLFADSDDGDNTLRIASGLVLGGIWSGFGLSKHLTRDMAPDYRFRVKSSGIQTTVSPTRIKDAPGLAVVGSF